MKVTGFTFIRNGTKYDYPFLESLQSLLPLCEEVIIVVGDSVDDTAEKILSINSPKIKIIESIWDASLREGGSVLSQQTNIALEHVTGDWAIYLQADEVLHEKDYGTVRDTMIRYKNQAAVEGLLFSYYHFYGNYNYVGDSRRWYRNEIRIIRPNIGVYSWGDAQGFRVHKRKLQVKVVDAAIYHYGWVKSPETQQLKQKYFNALWHNDTWVQNHIGNIPTYTYDLGGPLKLFQGTHPAIMINRIRKQSWNYNYDDKKVIVPLKERLLNWIEKKTGYRIGEYKNYHII